MMNWCRILPTPDNDQILVSIKQCEDGEGFHVVIERWVHRELIGCETHLDTWEEAEEEFNNLDLEDCMKLIHETIEAHDEHESRKLVLKFKDIIRKHSPKDGKN